MFGTLGHTVVLLHESSSNHVLFDRLRIPPGFGVRALRDGMVLFEEAGISFTTSALYDAMVLLHKGRIPLLAGALDDTMVLLHEGSSVEVVPWNERRFDDCRRCGRDWCC